MSAVTGAFEALAGFSTPLIWIAIGAFLAGAVLEVADRREIAVPIAATGWLAFGVFWVSRFHYYYIEFGSPLEGVLVLAALPLSWYAAYLLLTGRDQLLVVSRAIACMGVIYLPVTTIEFVRTALIESVAIQTTWVMEAVGYDVTLVEGSNGYQSKFTFAGTPEDSYTTYIIMACTGIGSIAVFGGLAAAVQAPLRRKVAAFAAATGVIHVLNIGRNAFVGLAAPFGWFEGSTFEAIATTLAGGDVNTSFFVAHHLISQSLSVVALIGITLLVVRILPEVTEPLEEVLYVLTKSEVDLAAAVGAEPAGDDLAPDGGSVSAGESGSAADAEGGRGAAAEGEGGRSAGADAEGGRDAGADGDGGRGATADGEGGRGADADADGDATGSSDG